LLDSLLQERFTMTVGLEKAQLVSVFPGESAGSQLRCRGENFGQEHSSTNVVSGPAKSSWDLQQSSPQERPNQCSFTNRAAIACSSSRDRTAEFRFIFGDPCSLTVQTFTLVTSSNS